MHFESNYTASRILDVLSKNEGAWMRLDEIASEVEFADGTLAKLLSGVDDVRQRVAFNGGTVSEPVWSTIQSTFVLRYNSGVKTKHQVNKEKRAAANVGAS